jgi:hypothetical protein
MDTNSTDNNPAVPPTASPQKKSRKGWWIVGVTTAITAALVFAGGALAVGRLSTPGREGRGEGFFGQRPNFQIEAARELPTTTPNVRGVVTQRTANMLAVGQRNGGPGSNDNGNTQLVDVIVNSDTTLYHDVTQMNFSGQPPSGPIQQKVEPGSLDGINVNSRVTVWGDQNGNQLTAKVLVYSDPFAFRTPQQ